MRLLISSPIQLLALLDLMWSPIQQLTMLNLMYYKSGIKIKIWPLWLGVTSGWPLTHNISGRSQAVYTCACVLLSCYVTLTSYSTFSVIMTFWPPVTPNDPGWKFESRITSVRGYLSNVYMHESHVHTIYICMREIAFFLRKWTFWPLWPQVTPDRDF